MNCTEFREKFADKEIIALVLEKYAYFYSFPASLINFFMIKYIDGEKPGWRKIFFYSLQAAEKHFAEDGTIAKLQEKARPLYIYANNSEQKANVCVFKDIVRMPNLKEFEGQKTKIVRISKNT